MSNAENMPNELIHCSSPYLLQHAYNPVHWRPWNQDAWELAAQLNRPVIVSIGYSTCHWCHVMEKESFEDVETAEIMNAHFVCIKVDREERPDVDAAYMEACQAMTGRGGWPLNCICIPNQKPIFAGTYFPKNQWQNILLQINQLWSQEPHTALDYAEKLMIALQSKETEEVGKQELNIQPKNWLDYFDANMDFVHGGMKPVPKFIVPCQYELLLDLALLYENKKLIEFVVFTCIKILNGGIYDTLRGGICRYSTDGQWFAPHFEKMLYDNAQSIGLWSRIYALENLPLIKNAIDQTIQFCESELKLDDNLFCSALDADSDGLEGKYYTFSTEEIQGIFSEKETQFLKMQYSFNEEGNWEGRNILFKKNTPVTVMQEMKLGPEEYQNLDSKIRSKLLNLQEGKNRPQTDTKLLTAWNALMITGLVKNYTYAAEEGSLISAERTMQSLLSAVAEDNGFIWRTPEKHIAGFAEDYAQVCYALLLLFKANGKAEYAWKAKLCVDYLLESHWDNSTSLFSSNAINTSDLFKQVYDVTDDVLPAANAVLCGVLSELSILFHDLSYKEKSIKMLKKVEAELQKHIGYYSVWGLNYLKNKYADLHLTILGENAMETARILALQLPVFVSIYPYAEPSNDALPFMEHLQNTAEVKIQICNTQHCFESVNSIEKALEILQDVLA